jgi:glycogen debranching enzyme
MKAAMRRHPCLFVLWLAACTLAPARASEYIPPGSGVPEATRGLYFAKKRYVPEPVPTFAASRDKLPSPILDGRPDLVAMYWKCWELAFHNMKRPPSGSPFVSNWSDPAFNQEIFQWDSVFILMFARYGNAAFPAIQTLDNFYCRQRANGFIGREIHWSDGLESFWYGPKDAVNPPLFSWAEVESFRLTGDKSRFAMVLPPLEHYVAWLNRDGDVVSANGTHWQDYGRRAGHSVHHLYWNTPLGSGMDNTPRRGNGWVDMSCQMVIQYNNLATICDELGLGAKATAYRAQARDIGGRINRWCWNDEDGFYYDVDNDGRQFRVKTLGGFWPMVAGVASPAQTARLVEHLRNEREFWRPCVFPTLSADEPLYRKDGGYWLGSVWAPTNFVIIKGLERCGQEDFATVATDRYLTAMAEVFRNTGTIWENYAPEKPFRPGNPAVAGLVGWSGDGPIALLIENMLGFRSDGVRHRLEWRLTRTDRHGIERLHVGSVTVSAVCAARPLATSPADLAVDNDAPLTLAVSSGGQEHVFALPPGRHELVVR